ncbi:30S ribosomal protein S11 [Candidatus Uhrbacteria bacterium]|nr:30S ribosomal protein S11 [Candidatus Uhrbacteria bacterium]
MALTNPPVPKPKVKKKAMRHVSQGLVFVQATFNNTIITVTDPQGNTLVWSSAGHCGFKGPKKSTPFAAGVIVKSITEKLKESGMKEVKVFVKGVGSGRDSAIRALNANGFAILSIKDTTPLPHNGCRLPKPRRI